MNSRTAAGALGGLLLIFSTSVIAEKFEPSSQDKVKLADALKEASLERAKKLAAFLSSETCYPEITSLKCYTNFGAYQTAGQEASSDFRIGACETQESNKVSCEYTVDSPQSLLALVPNRKASFVKENGSWKVGTLFFH